MELNDKFGIVIKQNFSNQDFNSNLYFENLIKNNKKIYLSSFVKNRLESSDIDSVNKIISQNLEDHIKMIRKNLRQSLRRSTINGNMIQSIISILNDFSYKILEIEYYIISKSIINDYYNNMLSNIIGDPLLKEVLKNDVMDLKNLKSTKHLLAKIKNLNEDFYNGWCIPFISSSFDSYSNDIDSLEYPIPNELMIIEKLNKKLQFYNKYKSKFTFLQNKTIYNSIIQNINNTLFQIPKTSKVKVFVQVIEQNNKTFKTMLHNVDNDMKEVFVAGYIKNVIEHYLENSSLQDIITLYLSSQGIVLNEIKYMVDFMSSRIFDHIVKNSLFDMFLEIIFDMLSKPNKDIDEIKNIFQIMARSDDKNLFANLYHKELIKRLLVENITIENIMKEKELLTFIGRKLFGAKNYYQIVKTIEDMEKTVQVKEYISAKIPAIKDWNMIITSFNTWGSNVFDIATNFNKLENKNDDGKIFNDKLSQMFQAYSELYSVMYSDRYLNWYLHTGSVDFKYKTNKGTIELKMLPLQGMVLELFSRKDKVNLVELFNLESISAYSRADKEKILDVFIDNNIVKLEGYNIVLNMDLQSCKLNIINDFFSVSSLPEKWEDEVKEEIANNKIDVVKTKINHLVKKTPMTIDTLYSECSKINVFKLDRELFDKAIQYMTEMDYIELNDTTKLYSKALF